MECACWCLNTTMCLTATYSGIDQHCTLFSARLNQGKLYLMMTSLMTSVMSFKNKTLPVPSRLTTTTETVHGIWNTTAGRNSRPSSPGSNMGTYLTSDSPVKVFDSNENTDYSAYGTCSSVGYDDAVDCGKNTGLYLSLVRGISLVVAFRICTATTYVNRDPIAVTIEGSNELTSSLTLGSSWTLIYNGSSGLSTDPGPGEFGLTQQLSNNSIFFLSYRILVTSKRGVGNYVHYSELELLGYFGV